MKLRFETIEHKDIDVQTIHEICSLKDESWPYGLSNQMEWMTENISDNDYHILAYTESLVGYANLVQREIIVNDNNQVNILGVGNVCIANEFKKKGIGLRLMGFVTHFLKENDIPGVLFCKEDLIAFYKKNGWFTFINFQNIGNTHIRTMGYNFKKSKIDSAELLGSIF